ncbi:MAG: cyclase family protein [Gemmatimonadota bacterium]
MDVSVPLSAATEPWPGDAPARLDPTARIADGDAVNLGRLTTSLHNGTHVDAPLHVREGGAPVDRLPLRAFMGPAVVVDAPEALETDPGGLGRLVPRRHRVLLRWGRSDHASFPERVPPVPPGWIRRLAERDVPLIGTDLPSLDPVESRELPAHGACVEAGIQILENLVLADVEPGRYELRALPLRLEGADASPVRAVLIDR